MFSSRISVLALRYAVEGSVQNSKTHTEGDKLEFSWYSDRPHGLVHVTHLVLSRWWFGKRVEIFPIPQPPGRVAVRVTCSSSTASDRVSFCFYTNNMNPPLNCYIMSPPSWFHWSCPSRCPSIVAAGMSLAHLRSKGGA